MKNIPKWNLYFFKLSMLLTLVCIAFKNSLGANLSTDSLGIVLLITWAVMAVSLVLNLMTYVSTIDLKALYMVVAILAVNTIFFSFELDLAAKKAMTFGLVAIATWLAIAEFVALRKRG
ncbi:MAG: hypothetical protein GY810_21670 [Aureispira sp.]|nr:hypothetical protein [Aureispira sp.]